MKTLTIPWSDDLDIESPPAPVPANLIMGQAVTLQFRSSPAASANGRVLEFWASEGSPAGTARLHILDADFSNRTGDFDLKLTATQTALTPGLYYFEVRDTTATDEHVLARRLVNVIASPPYSAFVAPPTLGPLADPNADRILFWDDSAGIVTWLAPGTGLSISGTTLVLTGGGGSGDMTKAVYDTNDDGVVNAAAAAPWAGITSKPTTLAGYGITDADPAGAATAAVAAHVAAGDPHPQYLTAAEGNAAYAALAHAHVIGDVTGLQAALDLKAPLASPALTGTPTVPTAGAGTNTTQAASTAFVTAAVAAKVESLVIAIGDETTALTTGTAKVTFRMPYAFTLTGVRASVNTASSSGLPTIDVKEAGVSIFSTLLTIDAGEETSVTAATPAVLSDTALADDAEITIDVTVSGVGAKGLKVVLIGRQA